MMAESLKENWFRPGRFAKIPRELFAIDLRSLALVRISFGLVILSDLWIRYQDLPAMYSDKGYLSIELTKKLIAIPERWSLHFLGGSVAFQTMLFAIAASFALALVTGWHTRVATIGSWVLLTSLHVRGPLINNGGDMVLRMLLFWSMFLPLGARCSIDALRAGKKRLLGKWQETSSVFSVGSAAFLLQLGILYLFTGLYKYNDHWIDGDSMFYALSIETYTLPLGKKLLDYPKLLEWIAFGTLWLELIAPVIIFTPWVSRYARPAMFIAYWGLHLGIAITMTIGFFSIVCMIAWIAFLPARFWESRLMQNVGDRLLSVLPDRICQFIESPRAPRIKKNKKAKTDSPELTTWQAKWRRFERPAAWASSAVCLFFLVYVVHWNVDQLHRDVEKRPELHRRIRGVIPDWNMSACYRTIGQVTMLGQRWHMFSRPAQNDSWFVAEARLRDGHTVDLLDGGREIVWEEPADLNRLYANHRQRKFFRNLSFGKYASLRTAVANYLQRDWNRQHDADRQVVSLTLHLFQRTIHKGDDSPPLRGSVSAHVESDDPEERGNFAEINAKSKDENSDPTLP